jgi:hypothetical protein
VVALIKKLVLPIIIFLFLTTSIFAAEKASTSLSYALIKDTLLTGEWAEFDLFITNPHRFDDNFRISVPDEGIEWTALTKPSKDIVSGMYIKPGETVKTRIMLKDINLQRGGKPYGVEVRVRASKSKEDQSIALPVKLLPQEKEPAHVFDVLPTLPGRFDPKNTYSLLFDVTNLQNQSYTDLTFLLESTSLNQEATFSLDYEETKRIEITTSFSKNQEPVEENLHMSILHNGNVLFYDISPISVVAQRLPFKQETLSVWDFLQRKETFTFTNNENVPEEQQILIQTNNIKKYFQTTNPETQRVKVDGKTYHSISITINPEESFSIVIESNYRIIFYILLGIGLIAFLVYALKHPITIIKQAEKIKTKEGGIVELEVVLSVKNCSRKEFKKVQVFERVPHMIYFIRDKSPTLKPIKTIKTDKGTYLKWEMDLSPREERIIPYTLRSSLSILGGIRIPPARLKMQYGKHLVTIKSNDIELVVD